MYSKEMFLKSEKISKKINKCNYWWHFCLVYLVYLFQFCLVPLFVISVQSSDSSFVHKTGLIFLVGSFYIVSDQYSTDFNENIEIDTGKSFSEALLFAEHGENMLRTKNVLNVRKNFLISVLVQPKDYNTGKSLSEALLFAEHGENMLCTKIVLYVRNNFYTHMFSHTHV